MNTFTQYDMRSAFVQMRENNEDLRAWMANILTRGCLDAPEWLPAGSHVANQDGEPYSRFADRGMA